MTSLPNSSLSGGTWVMATAFIYLFPIRFKPFSYVDTFDITLGG